MSLEQVNSVCEYNQSQHSFSSKSRFSLLADADYQNSNVVDANKEMTRDALSLLTIAFIVRSMTVL